MSDEPPKRLPVMLNRGTTEGAECSACPFSRNGEPNKPVVSEYPDKPAWLVVGEGPGRLEVQLGRCFVGPSGQEVNKILHKIGRPRDELGVLNVTLCLPPYGSPVEDRERAASACRGRLQRELASWPGIPILTLGAVAARTVIPKATLDAIDPPDVPKSKKRGQKDRQKADNKAAKKRLEKINKDARKLSHAAIKHHLSSLVRELKRKHGRAPDQRYLNQEEYRVRAQIWKKCLKDAEASYEQKVEERRLAKIAKAITKPRKKKPVKITDIMSTAFTVDVGDGSKRVVIPAIHPAALLRGGGATIGGTHSPDLAFVNLTYDAAKVNSIAQGKDIWLKFPIEIEFEDSSRAVSLFLQIFWEAIEAGEVAIDLETYVDDPDRHTALMAYAAKIRALGLATKTRSVSVLWDLLPGWCQSYVQVLLTRCTVIAHNALYDRTVLRAYGFILDELWQDSLIAHASAFPGVAHRLQQVTSQFFATSPWKSEFRNQEETPEKLLTYNAKDTYATIKDHHALQILVKRTKTERVYARDLKMSEIASKMHLDGMPVSREINSELLTQFSKLAVEAKRTVEDRVRDPKTRDAIRHHLALGQALKKRKADPEDFEARYHARKVELEHGWKWKIGASDHIVALLQAIGVQLTQTTAKGKVSTKKEILEGLVDVEVVREILTYRENEKMLNTFIEPIFDRHDANGEIISYGFADENDRVHPTWSLPKISGRWSSRDPVESNPPKEKYGKPIPLEYRAEAKTWSITKLMDEGYVKRPSTKRQIVPRPGRVLVGFDFAQLEARIIALLSGDPFLLWVFSTGRDIHTECAMLIFDGQQGSPKWDDLGDGSGKRSSAQTACRNVTKNVEYCLVPGTRLLKADLSWRAIGTLKPGDELIGFTSSEPNEPWVENYFEPTTVVSTKRLRQPCYRIVTTEGEIIASDEHLWVGRERVRQRDKIGKKRWWPKSWLRTDQLRPDDLLMFTKKPWDEDRSWEAGYVAGIYDGEGHVSVGHVGFAQNEGPTFDLVKNIVHAKGFEWREGGSSGDKCIKTYIHGGLWESMRFLGTIRPRRLHAKADVLWKGHRLRGKGEGARVLSVEFVGEREVIALETTTKTFIAEGFLSHNCTFYGGSEETAWKTLLKDGFNVKLADVALSVRKLNAKVPGVIAWQRATIQAASIYPFTLRDFVDGRMRVWPMGQVDPSEALNIVPQATGAAIMNTGMERMDDRLRKYKQCFPIVQIHDAAAYECWADDAENVKADLEACFPQVYTKNGVDVPFPIEAKIGRSLAEV